MILLLNNPNTIFKYLDRGKLLLIYSHSSNKMSQIDNQTGRILWSVTIKKSNTGNENDNCFNLEVLRFSNLCYIQLISLSCDEVLTFHKTGIPLHFLGDDVEEGMSVKVQLLEEEKNEYTTKNYIYSEGRIMEQN